MIHFLVILSCRVCVILFFFWLNDCVCYTVNLPKIKIPCKRYAQLHIHASIHLCACSIFFTGFCICMYCFFTCICVPFFLGMYICITAFAIIYNIGLSNILTILSEKKKIFSLLFSFITGTTYIHAYIQKYP